MVYVPGAGNGIIRSPAPFAREPLAARPVAVFVTVTAAPGQSRRRVGCSSSELGGLGTDLALRDATTRDRGEGPGRGDRRTRGIDRGHHGTTHDGTIQAELNP
jgi:hypothetical protein